MKVQVCAYPAVSVSGEIEILDDIKTIPEINLYISEHWDEINFDNEDFDYEIWNGMDFDWYEERT